MTSPRVVRLPRHQQRAQYPTQGIVRHRRRRIDLRDQRRLDRTERDICGHGAEKLNPLDEHGIAEVAFEAPAVCSQDNGDKARPDGAQAFALPWTPSFDCVRHVRDERAKCRPTVDNRGGRSVAAARPRSARKTDGAELHAREHRRGREVRIGAVRDEDGM